MKANTPVAAGGRRRSTRIGLEEDEEDGVADAIVVCNRVKSVVCERPLVFAVVQQGCVCLCTARSLIPSS